MYHYVSLCKYAVCVCIHYHGHHVINNASKIHPHISICIYTVCVRIHYHHTLACHYDSDLAVCTCRAISLSPACVCVCVGGGGRSGPDTREVKAVVNAAVNAVVTRNTFCSEKGSSGISSTVLASRRKPAPSAACMCNRGEGARGSQCLCVSRSRSRSRSRSLPRPPPPNTHTQHLLDVAFFVPVN
jgi:hypothetical protein